MHGRMKSLGNMLGHTMWIALLGGLGDGSRRRGGTHRGGKGRL